MNINNFKKGDRITRTEPVMISRNEMNQDLNMMMPSPPKPDYKFVGLPFTFLSIANGCLNIAELSGFVRVIPLAQDEVDWSEGWELFVEWPSPSEIYPEKEKEPVEAMQADYASPEMHQLEAIPEMPMYQGILITACIFFTAHSALNFITKKLFK